ncbi:MAG: zinc-ribbon domain-containing protein [Acutalibacteraceae bacterium]
MYTTQPYQQYPPAAANNPYADNPKLIKQVFTRPSAIGVIVSLGVILTVMLYQFISLISSYSSVNSALNSFGSSAAAQASKAALQMTFGITTAIYVIIVAVYLLPFIGFIIMYSKSKNLSDSSSPRAGITLNQVFAIISLTMISLLTLIVVFCLFIFAAANQQLQSSSRYYSSYASVGVGIGIFIMFLMLAFCVVMIIWSASAIRACSSMKKTLDGQGLFTNGIAPFRVCTIISVIILGLSFIFSIMGMFNAANLANTLSGGSSNAITQSINSSFSLNTVISFISSIAVIMLNIFLFAFASAYNKAVNASHYSIAYNGTNIYTADASNATAYYQSTYQGPQNNMSNPPYNVQNTQPVNTYYATHQQNINNNPQIAANSAAQINLNKNSAQSNTNVQPQTTEAVCSACGAKNKADSLFCQNCGRTLTPVQTQQATTNSTPQINLNKTPVQSNTNVQPQTTEAICSACGAKNKADSMFCQNCGNNLKAVKATQTAAESNAQINLGKTPVQSNTNVQPQSTETVCSACGAKNKSDSLFCQNCGNNLKAVKATQTAAESNAQINLGKTTVQSNTNVQPQTTETICSACGAKNKADSLFCQNCGTRLK